MGLSPSYVLDEMQFYEIESLLDSYYLRHKDSWEQARLIAYMTARVNSKGDLSPDDIMKFHWEKDDKPIINEQEQNDIELEIKQLEDILNNKA